MIRVVLTTGERVSIAFIAAAIGDIAHSPLLGLAPGLDGRHIGYPIGACGLPARVPAFGMLIMARALGR